MPGADPVGLCRALRATASTSLFLGSGWSVGPRVAVRPEPCLAIRAGRGDDVAGGLRRLAQLVDARRGLGGSAATGLAVLLGYELFEGGRGAADAGAPDLLAMRVDRAVGFAAGRPPRVAVRDGDSNALAGELRTLERPEAAAPAKATGPAVSSLPRERYLQAVRQVIRDIGRGEIYQANLCQRLSAAVAGDPFECFAALEARAAAPRSAYLEAPGFALASVSPEAFLDIDPGGRIRTWPIKGTRPRGTTAAEDHAAQADLLQSAKDRAELLMIVDLERNDLSRVCRAGSVRVPELGVLRSFPAVHHLVAEVEGRLREGVDAAELIRATFPGGSITGAPKRRAMQILRGLEPVARGPFTGSLFWFGDDGSTDSSILIRTVVFEGGWAHVGAGGGVVADSDPVQEWHESNHKARALCQALGFEPEDAS